MTTDPRTIANTRCTDCGHRIGRRHHQINRDGSLIHSRCAELAWRRQVERGAVR